MVYEAADNSGAGGINTLINHLEGELQKTEATSARSASSQPTLIRARTDIEAVAAWLAEYLHSAQTLRAYRKEAERLLLWLKAEGELGREATLSSLDRARLEQFESFLADPRPAQRWIGSVRARKHPEWRPFRGPLAPASRRQSLVILQGLYSWLVEAGYLSRNPFRLMRDKRRLDNRTQHVERYLERPLWDWLWERIEQQCMASAIQPSGDSTAASIMERRQHFVAERQRFLFAFAYLMAPRIAEMAAARMGDISLREGQWWWRVIGKGAKLAEIPLPPPMLEALSRWRRVRGMSDQPQALADDERMPLIPRLDGTTPLGDNQLYRLIKQTFAQAAGDMRARAEQPGDASELMARSLEKASPHWLRHTAITHQAQAGVELRFLSRSARHSRLDTTSRYLHAEDSEWQEQMARHSLGARSQATDDHDI
ncbi:MULTISPECIES: tyrosine-type recombinase/integrase [Cobetia]|uniref:tyrosine-type recombinase/integrase n=1 Tax=Cobetia TaxID=204286 RepID=UPI0004686A3D|nr:MULTISPECIES: site-specific integrase [Cobetia]